jgi:hypothetical protein
VPEHFLAKGESQPVPVFQCTGSQGTNVAFDVQSGDVIAIAFDPELETDVAVAGVVSKYGKARAEGRGAFGNLMGDAFLISVPKKLGGGTIHFLVYDRVDMGAAGVFRGHGPFKWRNEDMIRRRATDLRRQEVTRNLEKAQKVRF